MPTKIIVWVIMYGTTYIRITKIVKICKEFCAKSMKSNNPGTHQTGTYTLHTVRYSEREREKYQYTNTWHRAIGISRHNLYISVVEVVCVCGADLWRAFKIIVDRSVGDACKHVCVCAQVSDICIAHESIQNINSSSKPYSNRS